MKRLWHFVAARPFRSSLVVMMFVAVPGYIRQEQTIDDLRRIQADRETERIERAEASCAAFVAGRADNRAMWLYLFDLMAGGPRIPEVSAALNERLPALECNAENVPTPID